MLRFFVQDAFSRSDSVLNQTDGEGGSAISRTKKGSLLGSARIPGRGTNRGAGIRYRIRWRGKGRGRRAGAKSSSFSENRSGSWFSDQRGGAHHAKAASRPRRGLLASRTDSDASGLEKEHPDVHEDPESKRRKLMARIRRLRHTETMRALAEERERMKSRKRHQELTDRVWGGAGHKGPPSSDREDAVSLYETDRGGVVDLSAPAGTRSAAGGAGTVDKGSGGSAGRNLTLWSGSTSIVMGCCTRYAEPPYNTSKIVSFINRYEFVSQLPFPVLVRDVRSRGGVLGVMSARVKQRLCEMVLLPGQSKAFHSMESKVTLTHPARTLTSLPFSLVPPHVPTSFQVELTFSPGGAAGGGKGATVSGGGIQGSGSRSVIVQVNIVSGLFGDVPALPYTYNGLFLVLTIPTCPQFQICNMTRYCLAYLPADVSRQQRQQLAGDGAGQAPPLTDHSTAHVAAAVAFTDGGAPGLTSPTGPAASHQILLPAQLHQNPNVWAGGDSRAPHTTAGGAAQAVGNARKRAGIGSGHSAGVVDKVAASGLSANGRLVPPHSAVPYIPPVQKNIENVRVNLRVVDAQHCNWSTHCLANVVDHLQPIEFLPRRAPVVSNAGDYSIAANPEEGARAISSTTVTGYVQPTVAPLINVGPAVSASAAGSARQPSVTSFGLLQPHMSRATSSQQPGSGGGGSGTAAPSASGLGSAASQRGPVAFQANGGGGGPSSLHVTPPPATSATTLSLVTTSHLSPRPHVGRVNTGAMGDNTAAGSGARGAFRSVASGTPGPDGVHLFPAGPLGVLPAPSPGIATPTSNAGAGERNKNVLTAYGVGSDGGPAAYSLPFGDNTDTLLHPELTPRRRVKIANQRYAVTSFWGREGGYLRP